MTVEHLLLALLDNSVAVDVLRKVGADIDKLRADLKEFIDSTTPLIPAGDSDRETQPTLGFQRVLQRAVFHVQSSGRKEVTGGNVLVAIFSEQESQAVFFLKQQNVARIDVVNYIAHGISKVGGEASRAASARKRRRGGSGRGRPAERPGSFCHQSERAGQGRPYRSRSWVATRSSSASSRCCAGGARTTRCWWASRVSARRPLPKVSPSASSTVRFRKWLPIAPSTASTWARCWRAPSTAATSRSVSSWCSPS